MLAPTHRAFSVPVTVGCMVIATKTGAMYQGTTWTQSLPILITIISAWIASTLPDWDRFIPFLRHRGWSHAIWIPLLTLYGTYYFQGGDTIPFICFGIFCGWFSHIVGDSFSTAGVAWLYPLMSYEDYSSGAFVVKGFRGIFVPLYTVGEKTFISMRIVWYGLGMMEFMLFILSLPTALPY